MNIIKHKRLKSVFIFLVLIIFYGTMSGAIAQTSNSVQLPEGARLLSQEEVKQIVNSDEYKIAKEKTETFLKEVDKDIVDTFIIDTDKYMKLTFNDISSSDIKEKCKSFADKDFNRAFYQTYEEYRNQRKVGNSKPCIFIKTDGSEILFGSKDKDGVNILISNKKDKENWNISVEKKQGEKIKVPNN
jgi:hypothetical protein